MVETGSARRGAKLVMLYVLCIGLALVLAAVLIVLTDGPWRKVLTALIDGSIRKPGRWGLTLTEAMPVLIVALGAIVATRAGLVNIGQEGQLTIGAAAAAMVITRYSGPPALVAGFIAGAIGGALWAALAAGLKYWRKVPEVISTLLMVFIASQVAAFMLTKTALLLDPHPPSGNRSQSSKQINAATRIGRIHILGNDFPWTVPVVLLAAVLLAVLLQRSVWGFRLTVLGRNQRTAQRTGISVARTGAAALAISGGMAGLAGIVSLTSGGANYQFTSGFSNNIGWEGLLVALVARNKPLVCVPIALTFAGLRTGSGFLAATGVERSIVDVIRAMLVLALLMPPALAAIQRRRSNIGSVMNVGPS